MQHFRRYGWLAIALLILSLLTGCGNGTGGNASVLSGVQGQATRGPITPVTQQGTPNTAPLPNVVIVVRRQDGSEVARDTTDAAGRYKIGVTAGTYQVVGLAPNGSSLPSPPTAQTVMVPINQYITVDVEYDTGIR